MRRTIRVSLLPLMLSCAPLHAVQTATVGTGGTYPSIQEAVNACPADGCILQLVDAEYTLHREIWIGGKKHLSIEPSSALKASGIRPRLTASTLPEAFNVAGTAANPTDPLRPAGWKKWPISSTSSVGGSLNTSNPFSTTGFQYNGLLVIDSSSDIRIEGLHLDGGSVRYFLNVGVWSGKYDLVFGNIGVNLHHSRDVVIRDCRFNGFFAGLYLNSANKGGAVSTLEANEQANPNPLGSGAMGGHLVERNIFDGNWWAAYDEAEWDRGSVFRFNRCLANYNPKLKELQAASTYEGQNMIGGFLFMKDVPRAIHRIHNNTIWKSPLMIGHGYLKVGVQHLIYNNILGGFDELPGDLGRYVSDNRQLLSRSVYRTSNNVVALGVSDTNYQMWRVTAARIASRTACAEIGFTTETCFANIDSSVLINLGPQTIHPWSGWTFRRGGSYRVVYKGIAYWASDANMIEQFPGGGFFDSTIGLGNTRFAMQDERWVRTIPWKSTTPASAGFLEPDWSDSLVLTAIKGKGRRSGGFAAEPLDIGASVTQAIDTSLAGPRSLVEVTKDGANCWRLPIRLHPRFASARIVSLKAWSFPFATSQSDLGIGLAPSVVAIRSVDDSAPANGSSVKVCTNAGPTSTADLRLEIESEGTLQDGAALRFEPAVFLATAATPAFVGNVARATPGHLRVERIGGAIVARGLGEGELRIELRSLDGRLLAASATWSQGGVASISLPTGTRGALLVGVRQGDKSWQSLALTL